MLALTVLLVAGAAVVTAIPPPYSQSVKVFMDAKNYITDYLPPLFGNVHDAEVRKQLSFGVLAGVTGGLVIAAKNSSSYQPLLVVDEWFPYSWRNYNEISIKSHSILSEAAHKIRPIVDLMDSQCIDTGDVSCNVIIDEKVTKNPRVYRQVASLLLQLGKVSELLQRLYYKIDMVTRDNHEIPYLIDNVATSDIKAFVTELKVACNKMEYVN